MTRSEYCQLHERIAARLRAMASDVTTPAVKARLLEQAEEHERISRRFVNGGEPPSLLLH